MSVSVEDINKQTETELEQELEPELEPELEQDITFESQDTTLPKPSSTPNKYTEVDNLLDDPAIQGQRFVLISFISPEGIMNCKIRGVKIRGVYETEIAAREAADKLRKTDKYFDVFIGDMGKWLAWDPDPMSIKDAKYANKKQDEIMKSVHQQNNDNLNELVGRRKAIIDAGKKTHKQRVAESIKSGLYKEEQPTEQQNQEQQKSTYVTPATRDPKVRRQLLKKKLADRQAGQQQAGQQQLEQQLPQQLPQTVVNTEAQRITQKETELKSLNEKSQQIKDNITKMKEMYKKLSEQKQ